jgi:hypothetical protein
MIASRRRKFDVFISYRRQGGAPEARLLRAELEKRSFRVFLDVEDVNSGFFDRTLLGHIEASSNFLLVLSPGALDRCTDPGDWLRQEIAHAITYQKNIIPVLLPRFTFPPVLSEDIAELPRHQTIEYSHTLFAATLQKILFALGQSRWSLHKPLSWALGVTTGVLAAILAYGYLFDPGQVFVRVSPSTSNETQFASGTAPAGSSGDVVASLSGLGPPQPLPVGPNDADISPDRVVTYYYAREADGFRISYNLPYLERLRSVGEIEGISYSNSPFEAPLPALHVTISNSTKRNLVITAAVLDIRTSEVTSTVIPIIDDLSESNLVIGNQGWGEFIEPVLTITVSEVDGGFSLFENKPQTLKLETFADRKLIPIRPFVPERLRGTTVVKVSGTLEHGPPPERKSVKFTTRVRQRILAERAPPPSAAYDVFFKAGESGKQVVVDLQPPQQLGPGETEVFLIRLRSDKSSSTAMRVDFQTIEGRTVRGNDFKIDMFVPRDLRATWVKQHIGSNQ